MSAVPNDRRTRQLYLDAAIKRAQAKAREARREAAEDAFEVVPVRTSTTTLHNYAVSAVPPPRDPES